ncbi:isocitrate lyase/phosphoenolpyruvate mutase family protein [Burkholderia anthina]|uniref:isocitrate lyase/PEP mutase family protein n=1 Tax=Burkholderia anthina TaxID=179879 RepID=UPI001CF134D4|nr:isocitrate lyase/phosphoenolpyruvate mutase family protein [Burkholderia anthina]MCA8091041.1 isocitrate lyase/phosphoenolpyruvate mutase family protein [Burkholderia anthina]
MSFVKTFRQLHAGTKPLLLPNAWDAGSARLFESAGATAIATTSGGVAWALGYRDGGVLPIYELVSTVAHIARVVTVPLSVDIENGYSDDPKVVAENVMRLAYLGIAGINIEDGEDEPTLLADKVDAIRKATARAGVDLFVNVRSDVFLRRLVPPFELVGESIARGNLYAEAGADGLFLPGLRQSEHIRSVVNDVSLPLNLMVWPELADADELGKLGVRRLSAGTSIAQVAWGTAERLARDFLKNGGSAPMYEGFVPYAQIQELFEAD